MVTVRLNYKIKNEEFLQKVSFDIRSNIEKKFNEFLGSFLLELFIYFQIHFLFRIKLTNKNSIPISIYRFI